MGDAFVFEGADVILEGGVERVSVRIEVGNITALDGARDGAQVVDATGLLLAPALVDIHGDAFERQVMPRPGVSFPMEAALLETDRQLAANGIATAYHALTLSWEPGLRSVAHGEDMIDKLECISPRLSIENRVQLRWETFCFEAAPLIERALAGPLTPSLAFNDHLSMSLLHPSVPMQERPFDLAPTYPVADFESPAFIAKMARRGQRAGLSAEEYARLAQDRWARRAEVGDMITQVGTMARTHDAPMLSHDDSQNETRDFYRGHGAKICEFPMREVVAEGARAAGDWIVLGAPNGARGGSHLGSPGAADMTSKGLCDVLASDYYYPAMLMAIARMRQDAVKPLHELWKLVSQNPATASGLTDRGRIATGARADLVLIDWPEGATPAPVLTLSGGRPAFSSRAFGI